MTIDEIVAVSIYTLLNAPVEDDIPADISPYVVIAAAAIREICDHVGDSNLAQLVYGALEKWGDTRLMRE